MALASGSKFTVGTGVRALHGREAARGGPADFLLRAVAFGLGGGALIAFLVGLVVAYGLLPAQSRLTAVSRIVSVPRGATGQEVGRLLEDEGIIRDARAFALAARLAGLDGHLQAGDYELSPGMNLLAVLDRLRRGDVVTYRITIPEGLHLRQIARLFGRYGLADGERFLRLASDDSLVYGHRRPIDKPTASLEGYLFPDTYRLARGSPEEDIIKRMVDRFVQVALPVIEEAERPLGMSVHQVVTLASIIEKEAMVHRERPLIASVFLNRLAVGMPLQADPTVKYLLERPPVRLTYAHLRIDSPYNTYRYPGLPPGPIASVGLPSIQAVLRPAQTDYHFFIARGDGTHVFTRTFAEHVRARQRLGY